MALSVLVGGKVHSKRGRHGRWEAGARGQVLEGEVHVGACGAVFAGHADQGAVSADVQESSGSASGFELRWCPPVKGRVGENRYTEFENAALDRRRRAGCSAEVLGIEGRSFPVWIFSIPECVSAASAAGLMPELLRVVQMGTRVCRLSCQYWGPDLRDGSS